MNKPIKHEKMAPIIKTIAEKAISCFPATGDVIQAYIDAGSLFMNKFISQKDNYKDLMDLLMANKNMSQYNPYSIYQMKSEDSLCEFPGLGCILDHGSSRRIFPERGDIVVHGRNDTGNRNYSMVCDYTFSLGVRVYDYSDKSNPHIVACRNVDALIRVLE